MPTKLSKRRNHFQIGHDYKKGDGVRLMMHDLSDLHFLVITLVKKKIKCKHTSEATLFSMTSGYTTDGDDYISILHVKKLSKVNFNN